MRCLLVNNARLHVPLNIIIKPTVKARSMIIYSTNVWAWWEDLEKDSLRSVVERGLAVQGEGITGNGFVISNRAPLCFQAQSHWDLFRRYSIRWIQGNLAQCDGMDTEYRSLKPRWGVETKRHQWQTREMSQCGISWPKINALPLI